MNSEYIKLKRHSLEYVGSLSLQDEPDRLAMLGNPNRKFPPRSLLQGRLKSKKHSTKRSRILWKDRWCLSARETKGTKGDYQNWEHGEELGRLVLSPPEGALCVRCMDLRVGSAGLRA